MTGARMLLAAALLFAIGHGAVAQPLDLTQGGPITVTARDGIEWHQAEQEVIARGDAIAVRENVTVTADRLIAYYRKKAVPGAAPAQPVAVQPDAADTGGTEIYRLRAEGHVHIYTATDHAQGDVAVYDIDQAVLVMTGHDLKLTTPNEVLTAKDTLEYWPQKHMAVARGDPVVVTKDGRRVAADVLVAYTTPANAPPPASAAKPTAAPSTQGDDLAASGKLEKVEAFGHVSIRTPTDTAIGERAVYVPDSGIARLAGNVRITRGQNQLDGQEAEVNMKTGIARLLRGGSSRVTGLVMPNDTTNQSLPAGPPSPPSPPAGPAGAKR